MTALEMARANVATAALERCLRITQSGGFCYRLTFSRVKAGFDFELAMRLGAIVFIVVLLIAALVISR